MGTKTFKKIPIEYHPKLEQISIVVTIRQICEDFTHSDGFQVTFYGEAYALGHSVEIVNLYKKSEQQHVDTLVSTIIPGTTWLITGEHLIDMKYDSMILFPDSYQAVTLPPESTISNTRKNRFIILPYNQKT